MLKKLALISVMLLVFISMVRAETKINLKLSEIHAKGYPTELADEKFAELVPKYTNGEIHIDVFPGGALAGNDKTALEQVKVGAIQLARTSSGSLGNFNSQMLVFGLPYLFDSGEHMWAFLQGPSGQKMLADMNRSGVVGLTWYDSGARSFSSVKTLAVPANLKGQKINIMDDNRLVKISEPFGANANSMAASQVYKAIKTGVLDGAENTTPSLFSLNHHQVVKYYTLDEHCRIPEVLIINAQVWAKMKPSQQRAVQKAAAEAAEFQKKAWADYTVQALAQIKKSGVIVTEVSDKSAWKAAVKPAFTFAAHTLLQDYLSISYETQLMNSGYLFLGFGSAGAAAGTLTY